MSSGRGLSRARRGTDIHGEWSFHANGARASRSASGPLVSPPHLCRWCVEGRGAAVRPERRPARTSRCGSRGLPWARQGLCLSLCGSRGVCSISALSLSPNRGGWLVRGAACPFPSGVCVRPAFLRASGAPGAFPALIPKVPASELVVALPVLCRCLRCSVSLRVVFPAFGRLCVRRPEKRGSRKVAVARNEKGSLS